MIKDHPEIPVKDVVAYGLMLMIAQHCQRLKNYTDVQLSGPDGVHDTYIVVAHDRRDTGPAVPIDHEYDLSDRKNDVKQRALTLLASLGFVELDEGRTDRFFARFSEAGKSFLEKIDALNVWEFESVRLGKFRHEHGKNDVLGQLILCLFDLVLLECHDPKSRPEFRNSVDDNALTSDQKAIGILVGLGLLSLRSDAHSVVEISEYASLFEQSVWAAPRELRVIYRNRNVPRGLRLRTH